MKKRITAVLLCVALLLTLSVNVSADTLIDETQTTTNTQITPVTDEITVTVGEDGGTQSCVVLGDSNLVVKR